MAGKVGLDYFPLETSILIDDEKVFDLMDVEAREGRDQWAAFGRWTALLCRIYRDGPALVADGRMARKLARDLEMAVDEFEDFVGRCVDAGLVDRDLWEGGRVLTSRGIQRRWCVAKKVKRLPESYAPWSLLDAEDRIPEPPAPCEGDGEATDVRDVPYGCPDETADVSGEDPVDLSGDEFSTTEGVDGPSRKVSESQFVDNSRSESFRETVFDKMPLGKDASLSKRKERKEKEKKEEEKERGRSSSFREEGERRDPRTEPPDGTAQSPPCLVATSGDGTWYADEADGVYPTIGQALQARYHHLTGRTDFDAFVAKIATRCPASCRGDPDRARQCHQLLASAIDRFDPSRSSSPLPLALKIIDSDRGW